MIQRLNDLETQPSFYLVTGGAGFIGSSIAEELVKSGEKVRVLDNFSTGREENIKPFLKNIELIEGDIRSYGIVVKAMQGVDFVIHEAALPSVPRSIKDPISTNEVNAKGTLHILQAAKNAGVKKVVFASSSSIYGDSKILPKSEDIPPNPLSPYAVSKLAGEKYCQVFHTIYNLPTVCLRYFNVFGPKQNPNSQYAAVIPKFISLALKEKPLEIHGDGLQSRDFTYVSNVVQATILVAQTNKSVDGVMNVGCGEKHSVSDIVTTISEILKKNVKSYHTEPRKGDARHSFADITKAKKVLGYEVEIQFQEGLEKTIEHFRNSS